MRNLALLPNGLRAKFVAAFACMSILPFLVCLYLVTTFVFPYVDSIWLTSSIILITMLISFCGFNIMEEIVSSIIALSRDARRLAAHSRARLEPPAARDEVAAIKESLSMLAEDVERKTLKMKQVETMDEKIGIFTERAIREILSEELKRASIFQRPCAIIIARFRSTPATDAILRDEAHSFSAVSSLAGLVKGFAAGIEKIGRMGPCGVCLILPECSRQQANELAAKIGRRGENAQLGRPLRDGGLASRDRPDRRLRPRRRIGSSAADPEMSFGVPRGDVNPPGGAPCHANARSTRRALRLFCNNAKNLLTISTVCAILIQSDRFAS